MAAAPAGIPVFFKFNRKPVLVVGSGTAAIATVFRLLEGGGRVVLVAPALPAELSGLRRAGALTWRKRAPAARDFAKLAMIFPQSDSAALNRRLSQIARKRRIPVGGGRADSGHDIELGPVLWRGPLLIGFWLFQSGTWLKRWLWRRLLKQWGEEWQRMLRGVAKYPAGWGKDRKPSQINREMSRLLKKARR